MSWTDELLQIYNYNIGRDFDDGEPLMLPISHSTAKAQVEITIDENGEFMGASTVDKNDAVTVIPVTEDSATRGNGIRPMPFADKIVYIAGDYPKYAEGKKTDNSAYFKAYMEQLDMWKNSEYTHPAVNALFSYLSKGTLMADLIGAGVLKLNEQTGKLSSGNKIESVSQNDFFVRIILSIDGKSVRMWLDKEFQKCFCSYYRRFLGKEGLCYATGEIVPISYKHPAKVRSSGDKAKLFSANDESNFTYRGRFCNKEETFAIGYDFSQKIFSALRWLIQKQGISFGKLSFVVWASALQNIPKYSNRFIDDEFADEDEIPSTVPAYMSKLKKRIFGYKENFEPNTNVMLLGVDAATTGRLNLSFYSELKGSEYLENIEKWHRQTAWCRYNAKKKASIPNSFSLYEIINCAYGTEIEEKKQLKLECDEKLRRNIALNLIPCITQGRKLPLDIVNALYHKASNPLAYKSENENHRLVVETACGMIRKSIIEKENNEQEDFLMAYDPNITDRSYLFGCLLAIADKAENESYEREERGKRETNARRYWSAFVQHPYQTWGVIFDRLIPYFTKLGKSKTKYEERIHKIIGKMNNSDFSDNRRLEPMYLLGFSHYTTKMFDEDLKRNKGDN